MKITLTAAAVLVSVLCGIALNADDPYSRAEALAAQKQFAAAESIYRLELARRPGDWRLRLGLARVFLWDGRYAEAEELFARLIAERRGDPDALLGYAQAAYWWGDFRGARERYERILTVQPQHQEAQKVLADLDALTASRYEISAVHRDDSQPYDVSGARTTVSYFSDALTRWDVRLGTGDVAGGDETIQSVGGGVSAGLPRMRLQVSAWAEFFRFPSGERAVIGELEVQRKLPARSFVVASMSKDPLLTTAVSVDDNATATRYRMGWEREPAARWLAAVNVHSVDYSDGNRGSGADAWFLAPLFSRDEMLVRGGLSAAWKDTDLNRFHFTTFESLEIGPGEWQYSYTGVYDPYWTPHDLKEARAIVTAEWRQFKLQADAGYARDRALGFGPRTGFTPTPLFTFPEMQERSFRPWRAGAEAAWRLGERLELVTRYRHDVTAFYRANEFEASLVGRF